MSATEVLLVVGIIAYVIFRQVQGELLRAKRAVVLPLILTVMGFTDLHLSHGHLPVADITWLVVGTAGSGLIGCAFGVVTRLESREGYLWAQLPARWLWLWALLVGWRLVAMATAGAMHAHIAASSSTLLFSLGINRLAQAVVIVPRAMAMGVSFAPEAGGRSGGLLSGLLGDTSGRGASGRSGHDDRDRYERERYERDRYDRERYERERYGTDHRDRRDDRDDYPRDGGGRGGRGGLLDGGGLLGGGRQGGRILGGRGRFRDR